MNEHQIGALTLDGLGPVYGPARPDPILIRGDVEVRREFEADLLGLIRQYPDEWKQACEDRARFEDADKVEHFLYRCVSELVGDLGTGVDILREWNAPNLLPPQTRYVLRDTTMWDEPEVNFHPHVTDAQVQALKDQGVQFEFVDDDR